MAENSGIKPFSFSNNDMPLSYFFIKRHLVTFTVIELMQWTLQKGEIVLKRSNEFKRSKDIQQFR